MPIYFFEDYSFHEMTLPNILCKLNRCVNQSFSYGEILHIGHAKAICLDFGLAAEFGGQCNLRFADTNPSKEETEYVDAIMEDVRWLG